MGGKVGSACEELSTVKVSASLVPGCQGYQVPDKDPLNSYCCAHAAWTYRYLGSH